MDLPIIGSILVGMTLQYGSANWTIVFCHLTMTMDMYYVVFLTQGKKHNLCQGVKKLF